MSIFKPTLRTSFNEPIGVELFFKFPEIYTNEKSFLEADVALGATTLIANGVNFSADQYIVIGQPGQEKTEIAKISGTPTSTSINLTSALNFAHNRGDLIQFIPYNQITPERSTDSGSNFSPLTAIDIRPDATETYLQRTTDSSTDVYRFRFYNSTSALYSGYSDSATASGYTDNTVYAIKKRAMQQLGEDYNERLTSEFLNDALNEARRIVDQDPRVLRWSFRTSFNTDIGSIIPGKWSVAAPTDLRDRNTYKNILGLRIGRENRGCDYQDNTRFRQNYLDIAHTTLNGAITGASTSITLTSSGDFDESGNVVIQGESVTDTLDTVTYTANNESTNVISGVTGVAGNHATGGEVWQGATFGTPTFYTIDNAVIYFDVPFENNLAGENIFADYYRTLTAVDSDNDTLDEPVYDGYVSYLKFKIKYLKANGKIDRDADPDYKDWLQFREALVAQEVTGQDIYFIPS